MSAQSDMSNARQLRQQARTIKDAKAKQDFLDAADRLEKRAAKRVKRIGRRTSKRTGGGNGGGSIKVLP